MKFSAATRGERREMSEPIVPFIIARIPFMRHRRWRSTSLGVSAYKLESLATDSIGLLILTCPTVSAREVARGYIGYGLGTRSTSIYPDAWIMTHRVQNQLNQLMAIRSSLFHDSKPLLRALCDIHTRWPLTHLSLTPLRHSIMHRSSRAPIFLSTSDLLHLSHGHPHLSTFIHASLTLFFAPRNKILYRRVRF